MTKARVMAAIHSVCAERWAIGLLCFRLAEEAPATSVLKSGAVRLAIAKRFTLVLGRAEGTTSATVWKVRAVGQVVAGDRTCLIFSLTRSAVSAGPTRVWIALTIAGMIAM